MNGTCSLCGSTEPWTGCPLCFTPEPEPVHNDDDDAPRTTQLEDCDFHKLDDDFAPIACYNRMVEHAKELEREIAAMREQRDRLAEALELFLNRVQYVSIFMDGKRRGGRFDYRSSGFDDEVELAYEALKAVKGADQ